MQALQSTKTLPALGNCRVEHSGFDAGKRQRFQHLGMHPLVNARHRHQHRWAHGLQIFAQQRHRARIGDAAASRHGQVITSGALKSVGQRQKRQKHIVRQGLDARHDGLDIAHHVAVRQHHALGFACGARGVDDACHVGRARRCVHGRAVSGPRQPVGQAKHRNGCCAGNLTALEGVRRIVLLHAASVGPCLRRNAHHQHGTQFRKRHAQCANVVPLRQLLHHQQRRFAVGHDIAQAGRVIDGMQWHRHMAQRQRRLVERDGVQSIGKQQGNPRPGRQGQRGQCLAPVLNAQVRLRPGGAAPALAGTVVRAVGLAIGCALCAPGQQLGQGVDLVHAVRQRKESVRTLTCHGQPARSEKRRGVSRHQKSLPQKSASPMAHRTRPAHRAVAPS